MIIRVIVKILRLFTNTIKALEGWRSRENVKGNNNCSLCYVFIVKKMEDHIKNGKYYETANLKTGGPYWHYISHLSTRAHNYTHLTVGLGRIF